MIQYIVGQTFAGKNYLPGQDHTRAEITPGFIDILCFMSDPASDEIHEFRKGKISYGVFVLDNIPFFIVDFDNGKWNVDASVNLLNMTSQEDQTGWLNGNGNLTTLFLVDVSTNILRAMRTISVTAATSDLIRDTLELQSEKYADKSQVELRIAQIQHTISTAQMISRCKMFKL